VGDRVNIDEIMERLNEDGTSKIIDVELISPKKIKK